MTKQNRTILLILIISFLLRFSYIYFIVKDTGYGAESEFISYTQNIIKHHKYFEITKYGIKRYSIRLPIFPYMLYINHKIFGDRYLYYSRYTLVILSTLIVLLNYLISKNIFTEKKNGIITAIITMLLPRYIYECKDLNPTILYSFLVTLTIYILSCIYSKGQFTIKNMILLGITMGIAHLTRSFLLFFIAIIFVLNIYYSNLKRGILSFLVFLITFTIIISPWIYRNYKIFNKFIIGTTHFAIALYAGNNEKVVQNIDKGWDYNKIKIIMDSKPELFSNMVALQEFKKFIRNHPITFIRLALNRVVHLWRLFPQTRYVAKKYALISLLSYGFIFVFFIGGIIYTRDMWKKLLPYYSVLIYFTGIISIVVAFTRYRLYFSSIIIIFAAVGMQNFYNNTITHSQKPSIV